ncbi:MAG: hypothetical protein JXB15_11290 [Anaerolineales bacterium]|nr:hypothetical protein [Anaerolineales bacterium]
MCSRCREFIRRKTARVETRRWHTKPTQVGCRKAHAMTTNTPRPPTNR